jgi:hypothetical protein
MEHITQVCSMCSKLQVSRIRLCWCRQTRSVLSLHIRSRRGVAEALATLVALPVFLIFAGFLLYFGRLLYIKAAVEDAAAAGARWATTSLSGALGCAQAREAMQLVFNGYYANGYYANLAGFDYNVQPLTAWGRRGVARITVQYRLRQTDVPIFGALLGNRIVSTQYDVPIDTFNNRYAWTSC